jgi:amino acid transporter
MNELLKVLSSMDLFFIALCDMLGTGIFVIFIHVLFVGKKWSIYAIILIAISSIISGLCYSEIVSIFKNNSSEFNLIASILGYNYSTFFSFLIILFQLFTIASIIIAFCKYVLNGYDNRLSIYLGVFITTLTFVLLFLGIQLSANIISSIGVIIILFMSYIIISGFVKIDFNRKSKRLSYSFNFIICCAFSIFLFTGYDSIIKVYEEIHPDDIKYIPVVIISSIVVSFIIYLFLSFIMLYSSDNSIKKFYIIGAIIIFGTFYGTSLISSRFIYGLAKNKILPQELLVLSRYKTPYIILLLEFIVILIIVLFHNVIFSVDIANIFVFIILIHINIGIVIYRYNNGVKEGEFRMPFYYRDVPILPIFNSILIFVLLIVSIYILPDIIYS